MANGPSVSYVPQPDPLRAGCWSVAGIVRQSQRRQGVIDSAQLAPGERRLTHPVLHVVCQARGDAQLLIVSGVIDPHEDPRTHLPSNTNLTLCLLSPDPAVLHKRILARGWGQAEADEAASEHAVLQSAPFVDIRIETKALSIAETVARLRDFARVDDRADETRSGESTSASSTGVVLLAGPRAVGSSTVGFGLAGRRWRAGRRTGFLDLQQLGFIAADHRAGSESALAANQLASMHNLMTERGAELIIVAGHLSFRDRSLVRAALPQAKVTVVRLRANEQTLAQHVRARVNGSDARLAADDLLGVDQDHQDVVVAAALAEQRRLDAVPADDAVLDVSDRTADDVIDDLQRVTCL